MTDDEHFMAYAVRLARQRLGRTGENPSVGCVIVQQSRVVGVGITGYGGRPHAETEALAMAGSNAKGTTVYVTLEPCAHYGKTPPCAEALVKAGVARVVIGAIDQDPRVAGDGIKILQNNGINVTVNVLDNFVLPLYQGFFRRVTEGRPYVLAKVATSLDGRIATRTGHSQWLTNTAARAYGQQLRSRVDAIITGIGTVLADDPLLTCRLSGLSQYSPTRVILDRQGRLPAMARVVSDTSVPTWRYGRLSLPFILSSPHQDLQWDGEIASLLTDLGKNGIARVLVEAGSGVITAFLRGGFIDEIYWFRGASVLGADAMPVVRELKFNVMDEVKRFRLLESLCFSDTRLDILEK